MDSFAALAEPTRRAIVALLAAGDRNAGDLAGRFSIAGPSISRHLRVLSEAGVVSYRRRAQARIYHLEPSALEEDRQWMEAQLDLVRDRFDRLDAHLDAMERRGD